MLTFVGKLGEKDAFCNRRCFESGLFYDLEAGPNSLKGSLWISLDSIRSIA